MPFKKGKPKTGGRSKGAKNKIGTQLRETITNFLSNNFDVITEDFLSLSPKDRAKLYCDLLQYGLPRLQAITNEMQIEKLSDEELNKIIDTLKKATGYE